MAVKIQVRRGSKSNLPTLSPGEWGLTTDTSEVYIGGSSANIRVATEQDTNELQQLISSGAISSVSVTAQASAWSSNSITIQVAGLPAQSTAWIGLAIPNTAAQREAVRNGAISPTARSGGSITLTADGSQPTVDLPLIVYYGPASAAATAAVLNMLPTGATLQIPLDPCTNFSAKAGNAQVTLTWTDPVDKYATPEGETAQDPDQLVSKWAYTRIVRKVGSQPTGPNDGTVVVQSSVRDQYATNGFVDTGLTNNTHYYYGAFAYNSDKVVSEGAFVSATPQAGTPLSELTEGTLITINERGAPVQFYIAKQNYEEGLNGAGRVLVVRGREYSRLPFDDYVYGALYPDSSLNSYLNSTYLSLFTAFTKSLISTTQYYYNNTVNLPNGIGNNSVFILSLTEYGYTSKLVNPCGTTLPISSILQSTTHYETWTRSIHREGTSFVSTVTPDGQDTDNPTSPANRFRPCFTLPSTALVDSNNALIETA